MAGFIKKPVGHIFEGRYKAAEALPNGVFAEIGADGVAKLTAADTTMKLRVIDKITLWKLKALVLAVTVAGTSYFVENEWEINDNEEYDEPSYSLPIGKYVRMKLPLIGEVLVMSVTDAVYNGAQINDVLWPAVGGLPVQAPLAPTFTTNLSATKSVATGAEMALTIEAACADEGTLSYQWYKGTSAITDATEATYTVASAVAGTAGVYKCVVTNTKNTLTRTATSVACTVTVTA